MTPAPYRFNTVQSRFQLDSVDSDLQVTGTIEAFQEIPQDLLDKLKAKREYQDSRKFSELTKGDDLEMIEIAEIPQAVIWKWGREGFDFFEIISTLPGQETAQMILAKLRTDELTAFQLTSKTF